MLLTSSPITAIKLRVAIVMLNSRQNTVGVIEQLAGKTNEKEQRNKQ
jgi:hypothetical protein